MNICVLHHSTINLLLQPTTNFIIVGNTQNKLVFNLNTMGVEWPVKPSKNYTFFSIIHTSVTLKKINLSTLLRINNLVFQESWYDEPSSVGKGQNKRIV